MRCFWLILLGILASGAAMGSSVVIENDSDWEIHFLYLSPTSSSDWGPDQLGDNIIGSGSQYKLKGISCDTYDVRIVDEDADECILSEIPLCLFKEHWVIDNDMLLGCQNQTQRGVSQNQGTMTLYNASQWSIYELYISPSHQSTWGDDILGKDTWSSGTSVDVWNISCGDYDMRLVDEDSDVCQIDEIFLCGDEGTMTLTDDILLRCQGF